jgi:hypothetical protein
MLSLSTAIERPGVSGTPCAPRGPKAALTVAGTVGGWLNRRPQAGLWLDRLAGLVFIGLGLRLMLAR